MIITYFHIDMNSKILVFINTMKYVKKYFLTTTLQTTRKGFLKAHSLFGHVLPFPPLFITSSLIRSQPYFNLIGCKASERLLIRLKNLLLHFHICFCHSVWHCVLLVISAIGAFVFAVIIAANPTKAVAIQKINKLLAILLCTYLLRVSTIFWLCSLHSRNTISF